MGELTLNEWMALGLMCTTYLFIVVKSAEWLTSVILKQWNKRRKQSRQQRAMNEFYDAFELEKLEPDSTMRIATKGSLVLIMYRKEKE
ncbi:DUF4752 family protein [Erwinia sp. AnSW2-5]|uniref:DUF4752 family protein n=1 Tax=Erwinia sp. AnSW2-5 TaxID=3367692 RepID=UPI003858AFE7